MKQKSFLSKAVLAANAIIIAAIFILNYFYQSNGFDFTLKCVCSASFALLGLINLAGAYISKQKNMPFFAAMASGLVLAMLGDVTINENFIVGAGLFALGHVFFVAAYFILKKVHPLDIIISAAIFGGALAFLLLCPLLDFGGDVFKAVCIVYALIISCMLGKAAANFARERSILNAIIALGSLLFFFSDLMLVFDWFIGLWDWTNEACMGTYYPALCLLAFSMYYKTRENKGAN